MATPRTQASRIHRRLFHQTAHTAPKEHQRTREDFGAGAVRRVTGGASRYRKLQITHRSPKRPLWTQK